MTEGEVLAALGRAFPGLDESAAGGLPVYRGKVRDVVRGQEKLLLVASDRISAFDRVLSTVPFKGEVLTRIASWWFARSADILPNHVLPGGSPQELGIGRATLVRRAKMIPVEVVVRGYLAGSAWRDYSSGRPIPGAVFPGGMRRDQRLDEPVVTPSTKEDGGHDKPVSGADIIRSGLVDEELWSRIALSALALFRRGQELAARAGLVLVDTKYEFGLVEGRLTLADEIHTPDSSRYWMADSYDELFRSGKEQRELDKEPFRRWLMDRGFAGEGKLPAIPDEVRVATSLRYIAAYERITGEEFASLGPGFQAESQALARIVGERLLK